jgi:hypothetical protein
MPYYYFDSTALVKRYSMERGTRIVNKLMVKRGKVAILPTWTVTELYSAFSNRAQQGELTRDDCYSVIHKFERESAQGLFQFIVPTMHTYLSTKSWFKDAAGVAFSVGIGAKAPPTHGCERRYAALVCE